MHRLYYKMIQKKRPESRFFVYHYSLDQLFLPPML